MRVGTYNVQYGHDKAKHADMILRRFQTRRLDLLALLEAADYLEHLEHAAPALGLELIYRDGPVHVRNQAFLRRVDTTVLGKVWSVPMPATYLAPNGAVRHSSPPLCAEVNGIVYAAIHAPVHAWVAGKGGRRFIGPARRLAAWRAYAKRLLLILRRHRHVVLLGDWNATPDDRGLWSPNWLRRKGKARFIRPHANTGHGEIDYALAKGVFGVVDVAEDGRDGRSDHKLVYGLMQKDPRA